MTLKNRTIKVNKDKSLSKIHYGKKNIWWFFQWLKVCVDLEGSSIEFNTPLHKGFSGRKKGSYKQKIKITGWKEIDLKEIKSMKHHLKMTDKEMFNYLNKMFDKYIHLFGDFTIRYVKTPKDLIQDDNYFTVQIPLSKNRVEIDFALLVLIKENLIFFIDKKTYHKKTPRNFFLRVYNLFNFCT